MSETLAVRGYSYLTRSSSYLQSTVLLLFRVTLAWQLAESGWSHLHDVETMVKRFQDWHIPNPRMNVYISGYTELVGGWLLMAGLATRLISLPLVFNFIVAYLTASIDAVKELTSHPSAKAWDAIINDAAFGELMLALTMLAFGAGKVSIDHLLWLAAFRKSHKVKS